MIEKTWHLGPLGDLRPLICPEPGISMSNTRFGGVHQGLSGARTLDLTGLRHTYEFEWTYLDQAEYQWLNALHNRIVPGPLQLINPLIKNRLTTHTARAVASSLRNAGVSVGGAAWSYSRSWPTAVNLPGRSIQIEGWGATNLPVRFDQYRPTAVFPSETVTGSLYVYSSAATQGGLVLDYHDVDGAQIGSGGTFDQPIAAGWQRLQITRQAPANCAGIVLAYVTNLPKTTLRFAAAQLESGTQATAWEIGGGVAEVVVSQLETTTPKFPLRDCTLTLLEV